MARGVLHAPSMTRNIRLFVLAHVALVVLASFSV